MVLPINLMINPCIDKLILLEKNINHERNTEK